MISADYLGMPLAIDDLDRENLDYFAHCAKHEFRLQRCCNCQLFRYPPQTACPWCTEAKADWVAVEGKGTVHSYTEVHHAIQQRETPGRAAVHAHEVRAGAADVLVDGDVRVLGGVEVVLRRPEAGLDLQRFRGKVDHV